MNGLYVSRPLQILFVRGYREYEDRDLVSGAKTQSRLIVVNRHDNELSLSVMALRRFNERLETP